MLDVVVEVGVPVASNVVLLQLLLDRVEFHVVEVLVDDIDGSREALRCTVTFLQLLDDLPQPLDIIRRPFLNLHNFRLEEVIVTLQKRFNLLPLLWTDQNGNSKKVPTLLDNTIQIRIDLNLKPEMLDTLSILRQQIILIRIDVNL